MSEPDTNARDEAASTDGDTIDIRFVKAGGKWTATAPRIRNRAQARRKRTWQRRRRKAAMGTVEIVAGIALGIASVAVADTATTNTNARLLIAGLIVIGAVLAEWGVRHAAHKARRRDPSSNSQAHNLSKRGLSKVLNRRFRRG